MEWVWVHALHGLSVDKDITQTHSMDTHASVLSSHTHTGTVLGTYCPLRYCLYHHQYPSN